jgi:FKBP-type peptidyl-prolyl cis-trans isomerase
MILRNKNRWGALCLVLVLSSTGFSAGPRASFSAEDEEIIEKNWPGYLETPSGLRYLIEREGTGEKPLRGMKISVVYTGFLIDGTKFSENNDRENPFEFRLGSGEVIQGWEEVFPDMRKGEKRVLIVPYALAYGLRGRGDSVPRRSTLIFLVEIIDIEG